MHGVTISEGPSDWQIVQHKNGYGTITLGGTYQVHPAAIEVGVAKAVPIVRVMNETDNMTVIPWTPMEQECHDHVSGTFCTTLAIPAGGLYRIETSLETTSTVPDLSWLYRGDCILHFGVGNLFLIAGQSNAAGYGKDYAPDPPHLCVHLYRNRSVWDLACHPLNESTQAGSLPNEEMGIPGVSPYLAFAKELYQTTRMPVGLIQTALGGSPLKRWNPADGDLYHNLLNKIEETGGSYTGVLWYQGCSDADPDTAATYLERFGDFVAALRTKLGYEIPFFTFQLNRFLGCTQDEGWGMLREAQRLAAHRIPSVYLLPTIHCSVSDVIHNSAPANVTLGEQLAKQVSHVLNQTEPFFAPEIGTAVVHDGTLVLTFSHMRAGFQLFSLPADESGFTVTDTLGKIKLTKIRSNRSDKNHIYLTLERAPVGKAYLSFAWEANPVSTPPVDEITYLAPLAFYRYPIVT